MPSSSRDFQRAARQRLVTAEFLLRYRYNLDAKYLAGYAIECSLKALILHSTPVKGRAQMLARITQGASMHSSEVLGSILRTLGQPVPLDLMKRYRRSRWSTALRYETGRTDTNETKGFLKAARKTYDWVERQLP